MLKPDGDHGLGDTFLKLFLDNVVRSIDDLQDFKFNTTNAKVTPEFPIGPISKDGTEGGRIDILLRDNNEQLIIIENKIDAGDQPQQLLRYYNYATMAKKRNYDNKEFCLLYLTKDGIRPSNISLGVAEEKVEKPNDKKTKIKFECISYRKDIIFWLDECIKIAALYPALRETIHQYKQTLIQILNIMAEDDSNNLLEILTSYNNVETTLNILELNWEIAKRIRQNFIKKLIEITKDKDLNLEYDNGIITLENNSWIRIHDEKYPGVFFRIGVCKHTNGDGFRMDFKVEKSVAFNNTIVKFWDQGYEPSQDAPKGWTYLWSETGVPNSGNWWRWDRWDTVRDMTNGKMLGFIEQQLTNIKETEVLKELFELVNKSQNT